MRLKLIVPLSMCADRDDARTHLLRDHAIDLTHILECALIHWNEIDELDPDDLLVILERPLERLLNRRMRYIQHHEFVIALIRLRTAIYQMRQSLGPYLDPFLDDFTRHHDVGLEFKRFLARAPVIEANIVKR